MSLTRPLPVVGTDDSAVPSRRFSHLLVCWSIFVPFSRAKCGFQNGRYQRRENFFRCTTITPDFSRFSQRPSTLCGTAWHIGMLDVTGVSNQMCRSLATRIFKFHRVELEWSQRDKKIILVSDMNVYLAARRFHCWLIFKLRNSGSARIRARDIRIEDINLCGRLSASVSCV